MNVEVGFELDEVPTDEHIAILRSDARRITDDAASIRVERLVKGERHVLVTTFTMRSQAQYKVVGDIAHQFKLGFACSYAYADMWISFAKERSSRG